MNTLLRRLVIFAISIMTISTTMTFSIADISEDKGIDIDIGYSTYAECFGAARWRNFLIDGNGWELAVGDPDSIGTSHPYWDNLDFVYDGDYFIYPEGPNTFTYTYNTTSNDQIIEASVDGGLFSKTYNNGSLGVLDYLQIDVVGRNGQTVEFNDVILSIGLIEYSLGDFSADGWKSWYVTDVDLTNGFSVNGNVWLTNESTCQECSKINVYVGKLPDCSAEVWVDDDAESSWYDWNHVENIQTAVDRVCNNGGVIHVFNGTYGLTEEANQDGYQTALLIDDKQNLTIQAVTGHEPSIQPDTLVESNIVTISIENSNNLIIDNIDSDQTIAQFDHWHVFDSHNLTVKNCMFQGGEDGIDVNTEINTALIENNIFTNIITGSGDEVLDFTDAPCTNVIIQDNVFEYNYRHITLDNGDSNFIIRRNMMNGTNSQEAIRLISASDVIVENNIIIKNQQQGLYIDSGCNDITVQHNTFYQNDQENDGNGEIRTEIHSNDILIKNNIIFGTGLNPAFETTVASLAGENYNCVYNTNDITSFTFGPDTIVDENPEFMSIEPSNENFRLKVNSSCINSGIDLGVPVDIDGNSRDEYPDRGAFEYFELIDINQSLFDRGFRVMPGWDAAQEFVPAYSTLSRIELYLAKAGVYTGDVTFQIIEGNVTGDVVFEDMLDASLVPGPYSWVSVNVSIPVNASQKYVIVLENATGANAYDNLLWGWCDSYPSASGGPYDGGWFWFRKDANPNWLSQRDWDFTFRTYGY
jgi:parallel beta-helix repeat protein